MEIRNILTRSAVLCALGVAGAAHAQSANVNVTGVIVPPACSAQFVGGADLDWGEISHNSLSATTMTVLTSKPVTLQTQCDDGLQTHMAFWAVDSNASSAIAGISVNGQSNGDQASRVFGIGTDPITNQPLGNFTMIPTSSSYDGVTNSTSHGWIATSTHTETSFNSSPFNGTGYQIGSDFTVFDQTNNPAEANTFTVSLDVYPQLNKSGAITNAQQVPFSGTAQFYVRYF